jgi:ribosomal protein S17E
MWAGVEFAISGYIIHQIQKEKKTEEQKQETPNE